VPSLGERIVEHLASYGAPLDDGELAAALRVRRQVIAEACRELEAQGAVVRGSVGGARVVNTVRTGRPPDEAALSPEARFAAHARRVLSARWGTALSRRPATLAGGDIRPFDLVSGNGRIVGDVVWLEHRGDTLEAKWAAIAEAVLVVGHAQGADRHFLVFGESWDVLSRWLARYAALTDHVEVWFLDGDRLERLA
jgi:hypothetical protein